MNRYLFLLIALFGFQIGFSQTQDPVITIPEIQVEYDFYSQFRTGTAFKTNSDGYLLKIRLLIDSDETGEKTVNLWENIGNQNKLLSGPYIWNISSGNSGWQEFEFPYPISLIKNKIYIISVGGDIKSSSQAGESLSREKNKLQEEQLTKHPGREDLSNWYIITSARINVIVKLKLTPGSIGHDQTICYEEIPETLRPITAPSGGTGTYFYQWQSSSDTIHWIDIPDAKLASYSPPSLKTTTWYRRKVSSGIDKDIYSNPIRITVYPQLLSGTIGDPQTICYNTSPSYLRQNAAPTGGSGSFVYQWQISTDYLTWTDIPEASQNEYVPPALNESRWYRLKVSCDYCGVVYSNEILITVIADYTPGSIGLDQTICSNSTPSGLIQTTPAEGGTGSFHYQWQISTNNEDWTDISGANSTTYSPPNLNNTTWYRRNVTSANCDIKSSNTVQITVYPDLSAGTIGASQTICYNSIPARLTQITAPSGGTGIYYYQWQLSQNNTSWTDIPDANEALYSPPALTESTWYKRNVTSGNCGTKFSNTVYITVYDAITAGAIGSNQSICANDTPSPLVQLSPATGGTGSYAYQWQTSTDNNIWTNITGANSITYSPPSLAGNRWYRRVATSGNCGSVSSNIISITVYPALNAGSIGFDQTICYNSVPATLVETEPPSGGSGQYSYQWQSSTNNISWSNINNTNEVYYTPPSLTQSVWYRRNVISGCIKSSNSVRIDLYDVVNSAQLHEDKTILENTSTTFNISISGGTPPYTVSYSINGTARSPVTNYISGNDLSTGVLTAGSYTISLISVTDVHGCHALSLGYNIVITVVPEHSTSTNKALIIVNSGSTSYANFSNYIKPYMDNFGIPYDVCNINAAGLPSLSDYAVIIFGHRNVYSSGYPIAQLEAAVSSGTGLYSFDPHLFDYSSGFNTTITARSVSTSQISILNTSHYITQQHAPDSYNPGNNVINLLRSWTVFQNSNLIGGTNLATMTSGGQTIPLLQVTSFGNGRIVKWCGYDWIFENYLGPVHGMDDLIWRGIVWAARKPFVMQGMPPFITMRVDDSDGSGGGVINNFQWIQISNEFGFIPWCGIFTAQIPQSYIQTLKNLTDNNNATSSPHAFGGSSFIYFNHNNLPVFDAAANARAARDFYVQHGLKISKYFLPHYYEVSSSALPVIRDMGGEFLGIHMLPDNFYYYPTPWINCGPYRINRNGMSDSGLPVYYGGYVNLSGIQFFNCLSEIRDDGGYEWYPDANVTTTVARGVRHLRRSLNSMVLACLFTHEHFFVPINATTWREILRQITSAISEYDPEYRSMDYTAQYIRAKSNIRITDITDDIASITISYTGSNDMNTRCYLFSEQYGQITSRFVILPQTNGNNQVTVQK